MISDGNIFFSSIPFFLGLYEWTILFNSAGMSEEEMKNDDCYKNLNSFNWIII